MDMPKKVNQAVLAVWITLAIDALIAVANRRMGEISSDKFFAYLAIYGLFCIFPYKLSKGSNPARYVYSVLIVVGYLLMLGGSTEGVTKLDNICSVLTFPVYAFIIWRLFSNEANEWFTDKKPPALPTVKEEDV